jgi:Tol biopolymer transport system component
VHNNLDLWVEDLERGPSVRVTTDPRPDIFPVWSPDGRYLAYVSGSLPGRSGEHVLTISAADGTGILRRFPCPTTAYCEPTDWMDDRLLVNLVETSGARDVWIVSTVDGAGHPLLAEEFAEQDGRFAPDRPWIAYVSTESGRPEVSLRSLREPRQRVVVSSDWGTQPVWRRAELFFVDLQGRLRAVAVQWQRDGTIVLGRSHDIDIPRVEFGHWGTQYDVSPDGRHFYLMGRTGADASREIHIVSGWSGLLR